MQKFVSKLPLIHNQILSRIFKIKARENGEVFLNQRRIFILPTRAGLAMGVLLMVMFLTSINYSLSLGYWLVFFLASCATVDMVLCFRNILHLYLSPVQAKAVHVGEDARFECLLVNRHKFARYALRINFVGDGKPSFKRPMQFVDLEPHSCKQVGLSMPAVQRGWLLCPRIRLRTQFPLGWFCAWSYWEPNMQALIYPGPEEYAPALPLSGEGGQVQIEHGHGDEFSGIRTYQSGDSRHLIAWRHIARLDLALGGQLVSKNFETESGQELCLDFMQLPVNLSVEEKLERMCRWVLVAEQGGLNYAFRLPGANFPSGKGWNHQQACLRALALYGQ